MMEIRVGSRVGAALRGGVSGLAAVAGLALVIQLQSRVEPSAMVPAHAGGLVGGAAVASSSAGLAPPGPAGPRFQATDSFPHREHQGLFPLCQGCHEGIDEGDGVGDLPEPESCNGCHDGVEREPVVWIPSAAVTGPMDFSHVEHVREVAAAGDEALACADCHVAEGGRSMQLVPLDADRCLTCHVDEGPVDHYGTSTDCASCHRVVAAVDEGDDRMRDYPKPNLGHVGRLFLLENHGEEALSGLNRCATCHVQDQCVSCHVDPGLDALQRMPGAPADWAVPLISPTYPVPTGHDDPTFTRTHGRPAPAAADCSTCHTQNDCAACHLEPLPQAARELQERPQVRAPGVGLEDQLPESHQSPFFQAGHPLLAATGPDSCASCHTEAYCAECHNAPQAPGYHPEGFALRHSAPVGSQVMECSNCHNAAAFCRECHADLGIRSSGRLGTGFHDAEPVWLLRHGAAARQGLEQCASCHTQQSCLQCHSTLGAFKVNPHGRDFDPDLARSKNPWICRACHIGVT